MEDNILP